VYSYDSLSRLIEATATGSVSYHVPLLMDQWGNATCNTAGNPSGPACATVTFDTSSNRMTAIGTATPTYDASGDLTSDGTCTYTWDAEGRIAAVSGCATYSMTYNALGQRAELAPGSGNKNEYLYGAGGEELGWFYSSGVWIAKDINAGGRGRNGEE
jgi:hypothetical protein